MIIFFTLVFEKQSLELAADARQRDKFWPTATMRRNKNDRS